MKLTFKDLKQQKFTIEAEASETIGALKEKISAEKGWEPSSQKLIYSGKILQDDNTIESYKIEEKGFIVCMTSKPKPAPKAAAPPATPAPVQTPSTPAAPAAAPAAISAQPPATPSPAPASVSAATSQSFNDPSALAIGNERAEAIANMESMGFPREQIDRAMRAAFFNPDRAVEYLLNGIPASAQQEQAAATPAPASVPSTRPTQAARPQESGEGVNLFEAAAGNRAAPTGNETRSIPANLDFLRADAQFQRLRQVVQQQPAMLEPILQQVATANPQLAQMISQNPQEFMQLLAEDGDGEGGDVQLPPGLQQIAVTDEERDAIERVRVLAVKL